eukprot:Lithocolla_globosa_v1_NODE_8205_length_850_cov_35.281761.p1 type:complete len:161 gc:universal NODE_8205_length_850_cov_35.281761:252-734(+)
MVRVCLFVFLVPCFLAASLEHPDVVVEVSGECDSRYMLDFFQANDDLNPDVERYFVEDVESIWNSHLNVTTRQELMAQILFEFDRLVWNEHVFSEFWVKEIAGDNEGIHCKYSAACRSEGLTRQPPVPFDVRETAILYTRKVQEEELIYGYYLYYDRLPL